MYYVTDHVTYMHTLKQIPFLSQITEKNIYPSEALKSSALQYS